MKEHPAMTTQPTVDLMAVLVDLQRQITDLNAAVASHQATIDMLTDELIRLLTGRTDAQQ
jgi:uncharacterized coiled-coil protein SlyX